MGADDLDSALDVLDAVASEAIWLGTEAGFDRQSRAADWERSLGDGSVRFLVVVDPADGRMLGHGRVHLARYGVAEIGMLLAEEVRGRGVGRRLLDALVDAARELGAHKVELQVWPHNTAAIRLYQSHGFVVEGRIRSHYRRASGQLWDAILMGLLLDPAGARAAEGSGMPDAPGLPATISITP